MTKAWVSAIIKQFYIQSLNDFETMQMFKNPESTTINISTWSIIKIFLILLGFWFLYLIRDVILILFVAILLASILEPPVAWLHKKKIPRPLGVLMIYIVLLAILVFVTLSLIPPLTEQIRQLATVIPIYTQQLLSLFQISPDALLNLQNSLQNLAGSLARGATTNVLGTAFSFFGGFVSAVIVLVVTFYMVVQEDAIRRIIRSIIPGHYQPYLTQLFSRMQEKVGHWLRGMLILALFVAALVYIGLTVLQVPYALVLAVLAGLFEFVPYVGPIAAAIPTVLIGLAQSPLTALLVVVMYVLIQQLENHVLVPKIMARAVGLNPIVVIVAIMIGIKIGGVIGALVSVPVVAALSVLVKDFYKEVTA